MIRIERNHLHTKIADLLDRKRSVVLLGPRQCGKTTISRLVAESHCAASLAPLQGLVVLDEIQRRPDLMPALRVLLDRVPLNVTFLLLGSASPDIIRGSSESLAGRVAFIDMHGFNIDEAGSEGMQKLWMRGGFPRAFLAKDAADSFQWREGFIRTFLERDLAAPARHGMHRKSPVPCKSPIPPRATMPTC